MTDVKSDGEKILSAEDYVAEIIRNLEKEAILREKEQQDWERRNDTNSKSYKADESEFLQKPQGLFRKFYDLRFASDDQLETYIRAREDKVIEIYRNLWRKTRLEMMLFNRDHLEREMGREMKPEDTPRLFREYFEIMKKIVVDMALLRLCRAKDILDEKSGPSRIGGEGGYTIGSDGKKQFISLMNMLERIPNIKVSYSDGDIPISYEWLRSLDNRSI